MLVSLSVLVLTAFFSISFQLFSFKTRMVENLSTLSDMLADNCRAALSFNVPQDASEILSSLKNRQPIEQAILYNEKGSIFATFYRDQNAIPISNLNIPPEGYTFSQGKLLLWKPVIFHEETLGTLYLQSDLSELNAFLKINLFLFVGLLSVIALIAYSLASLVQKFISSPLADLAHTANQVSKSQDFSLRATQHSDDELGLLAGTFNEMLGTIEERETALRQSEEKYREIFDSPSDAIFLHDGTTGTLVDVNQTMLDMYGYTRDEALELSIGDFSANYEPYTQEQAGVLMRKALKEGPQVFEWLARRKNNSVFWVEVALKNIKIGNDLSVLAVVRDISQRKQVEDKLRQKESQQALILGSLPMAFYIAQPFGEFGGSWVSEQIDVICGFTAKQFMSDFSLWASRLHPDDRERTLAEFETLPDASKVQVEYRWQHGNGRYIWLQDSAVLVRNDDSSPKEIIGTWLDITAKKEAEAALVKSEFEWTYAMDFFEDAIYLIDLDDKIIRANKAFYQLTGLSAEKTIGQDVGDIIHPDGEEKPCPVCRARRERRDVMIPMEADHPDNPTTVPIEVMVKVIRNQANEATAILMGIHDLSRYRQTEATRHKLESQLRQAQKMEAIGTLAGGIAHDFNNILSAIFGFNELADMHKKDQTKLTKNLAEVRLAAERARDLVKQILTFSRRTGQEKRPLQVALIVKEALKLLRASIPSTIDMQEKISSNAQVLADPTQIHQIIMNLCTNAYQAMRQTGGVLSVTLEETTINSDYSPLEISLRPGRYVHLEVSDTGPGMDPEVREKIFEPYFTTKEVGEGTGMGLSVVHGIVHTHGGKIYVSSEPGQGSAFHVYLPAVSKDIIDTPQAIDTGHQNQKGNERILFVDDAEELVKLTEEILSSYGYHVSCFTSGVNAWKHFQNSPDDFDLVITDQTMPGMTGSELGAKIKSIRPDIPIILCTGFSETVNKKEALAMGINQYVLKPVVMSSLLKSIRSLLDRRTHNG